MRVLLRQTIVSRPGTNLGSAGLGVWPTWLRDGSHGSVGLLAVAIERHVAERDDPDQTLVPAHHRQPAHLVLAHVVDDVVEFLILEAVADLGRHRLAYLGVRPPALRHGTDGDVPVREHADQAVVLAHRQHACIELGHSACSLLDRVVRARDLDPAGHDLAYLHGGPSGSLAVEPDRTSGAGSRSGCRGWASAR